MHDKQSYWIGVLLTGLGAIVLSPDALLFRLLESDIWTAAFWRLLLMGITIMGGLLIIRRWKLAGDIRAIGWALAPAATCMTISNLGFVYALTHSTVAETLTILATAPVFAAIFAAILGERPPIRTWAAALAIAAGIAIIFDAGFSDGTSTGNVSALIAAVSIAGFFTIGRVRRDCDMTPALGLSSILSAVICGFMADTLQPADGDWPALIAVGVFILPIAFTLITIGPRRLPAAEVGLLMLLETALGPLWVWIALDETPTQATLLGGGVIVAVLATHSLAMWRVERPEAV